VQSPSGNILAFEELRSEPKQVRDDIAQDGSTYSSEFTHEQG